MNLLAYPIVIPAVGGLIALLVPRGLKGLRELIALVAAAATLVYAGLIFKEHAAAGVLTDTRER